LGRFEGYFGGGGSLFMAENRGRDELETDKTMHSAECAAVLMERGVGRRAIGRVDDDGAVERMMAGEPRVSSS